MLVIVLFLATFFLAYTNGANDNFKGVATLYGSRTLGYKSALAVATVATFLGSVGAIFLANGLVASFSGKGLVPQDIAGTTSFLIAVGLGAGGTVLLATRLGFPISTTHALVGGLVGAGLVAAGSELNLSRLGSAFVVPLLVSPFIAFVLGLIVYSAASRSRKAAGLHKESCLCVGEPRQFVPVTELGPNTRDMVLNGPTLAIADQSECVEMYTDRVWGLSAQRVLDVGHIASGATVSFARGLNDTPKIAGLLVAAKAGDIRLGMVAIATGMAVGGLLNARRVAETMSRRITDLNPGQGFAANLVTGFLVVVASRFGVPVSTTHVSVGSIFGIGAATGEQNTGVVRNIVLSWVITLPVAMVLSAAVCWALKV